MAPNVGSRIKWTSSFFLSYSWFGLPFLSYYSFGQSFLYTQPRHSFNSHLALLKSSTNGHASYHGLQFQVTPDVFCGWLFRPSSLCQLHSTVSFGTSTILDRNIASGPFTILSWILSQEWNLKDALGKQMTLKLFGVDGSIITLLLGELLIPNNSQWNESPKTMCQYFTTVPFCTLHWTLCNFMDTKHIIQVRTIPAESTSMRVNTACQWHSTLQSVISQVPILYFWNYQECLLKDTSLLFWWSSLSLEYLALLLFRHALACGNRYVWLILKLSFDGRQTDQSKLV